MLREHSAASAEAEQYATLTRHLVVIVLNTVTNKYPARKVSGSLWIVPTNAFTTLFAPIKALILARKELFFQGRLQVDVVAAQDAGISGFTAWLIAVYYHRPFQMHIDRNVISFQYGRQSLWKMFHMCFARFLAFQADSLHITDEQIRATLAELSTALSDRAVVAPRFMDVDAFLKEPVHVNLVAKYPQFKVIILMVAPLVRSSNVDRAIEIMATVVRSHPYAGLVIVGEGPMEKRLRRRAAKIDLGGRVAIEGWTNDLSSYYKTARIFLMTGSTEDYGDSIAYAAAASCAIVSSRVPAAEALVTDGQTGYLCDPYDHAAFVDRLSTLIKRPELCSQFRMNAGVAVQSYFSSDKEAHLARFQESLQKAIGDSSAPRL